MFDRSFEPRDNGRMETGDFRRPGLPSRWAGVGAKLPPALENLVGPADGVVELPLDLAWSGDRLFDLADPAQRYLYHMTVLTSAVTREHYTSWLNASLLRSDWGRLRGQGPRSRRAPVAGHRVDVLKEPLNHPAVSMEFGPVIALADAVALKMGALHDRALPRDVLGVHGASSYFTRADLEVKAWALDWSTEIGLDMAESESLADEDDADAAE
jgi:hypothetical protein